MHPKHRHTPAKPDPALLLAVGFIAVGMLWFAVFVA